MMPNKNNKTRKSPTPVAGHTSRDRSSPTVRSQPLTPTHSHSNAGHSLQNSPRVGGGTATGTGRDRQPSPKLPATGTTQPKHGTMHTPTHAGSSSSSSFPTSGHPSPKQPINGRSRPVKTFTDGPINDSDLLSQSEYLDGHEMDVSRSVLLESPAAKSILGGEVARQKHEFYMSQSRMAAHQEADSHESDDDTPSMGSHAIIERVGPELEAASAEELSVLMEHVQMLMEQRSRKEPNPTVPASTNPSNAAAAAAAHPVHMYKSTHVFMGNNAITTKPINSAAYAASQGQGQGQAQTQGQGQGQQAGTTRQNIPSPFKSLDQSNMDPSASGHFSNSSSNAQPFLVTNVNFSSHKQPYVHHAGNYRYSQPPTTSSPEKSEDASASASGSGSGSLSGSHPLSAVAQLEANASLLADGSSNLSAARSQLRRSLSGDATHMRSSRNHPLATGYHTLQPSGGTATTIAQVAGATSKANKNTNPPSNANIQQQSADPAEPAEEDDELGKAFGKRTTPTKLVPTDRSGAVPPTIVEAWPPSPIANYRPSPPILESIIKAPVHSPKVKKHRTPLHPPANRPVHAQPGNVNVNVNVTGNGNSNGNNTDDDSTNTHTDSLTLQSFESGTNTQTYSQTSSHIVKRSRSHGDEAFAHPGREAAGLVTSPKSAFDDISVGSGNSGSGSVKSSRSMEQQSGKGNIGRTMYSYLTANISRM